MTDKFTGASLQTIWAGLRGERRLQDAVTTQERWRSQNTMHPGMRVAVLLQGDLFIWSGTGICVIPIPLIAFGYYALHAIYLVHIRNTISHVRTAWYWTINTFQLEEGEIDVRLNSFKGCFMQRNGRPRK